MQEEQASSNNNLRANAAACYPLDNGKPQTMLRTEQEVSRGEGSYSYEPARPTLSNEQNQRRPIIEERPGEEDGGVQEEANVGRKEEEVSPEHTREEEEEDEEEERSVIRTRRMPVAGFRKEPKIAFLKGEMDKAEDFYSSIIRITETIPGAKQEAVVFANRAAARLQLNQYNPALIDAEKSITLDHLYVKGYHRKAKAHVFLLEFYLAIEIAETAETLDQPNITFQTIIKEAHGAKSKHEKKNHAHQTFKNAIAIAGRKGLKWQYQRIFFHGKSIVRHHGHTHRNGTR